MLGEGVAKYKTPYGVLVELIAAGDILYMKAPFPGPHLVDLKSTAAEQSFPHVNDPEALLGVVPIVRVRIGSSRP